MFKRYLCTYCGDPAEHLDHVVPHSYTAKTPKQSRSYRKETVVPCCDECNHLLSNRMLLTVSERAEFIHSKLPKRYGKILKTPVWTLEELEELGYAMRVQIENNIKLQNNVNERISWASTVYRMDPSIDDVWDTIDGIELPGSRD